MILRFFLLFAAVQALKTPKFKWGQDQNNLYLTIFSKCTESNKKLTISEDIFHLECDSSALKLTLRDDIDPEISECKTSRSGDSQVCKLKKKNAFTYDRLTSTLTELRKLKGFLSVDYNRMESLDDDDDSPYPTPEKIEIDYSEGSVVRVTDENFEIMTESRTLIIVAYYPMCSNYNLYIEKIIEAAKSVRKRFPSSGVTFGIVDAVENPKLRRQFNASCQFDLGITIFKWGANYTMTKNRIDLENIETFFDSFFAPLIINLDSLGSLNEFTSWNTLSLVGFFSKKNHPIDAKTALAVTAAGGTCGIVRDSIVMNAAGVSQENSIFLFKNGSQSKIHYTGSMEWEAIERFVTIENWELVEDYEHTQTEKMEKMGLSGVILYLEAESNDDVRNRYHDLLAAVELVARQFRDQIAFVLCTKKNYASLFGSGVLEDESPILAIGDDFDYESLRYKYDGDSFDSSELIQFCQNFLDKKLSPTLIIRKSTSPPPEPFQPGTIRRLVQRSWQAELTNNLESDVLVMIFHQFGNPNFQNNKLRKWNSTLVTIASYLKEIPNTMVASYCLDDNYWDGDLFHKNMDLMGLWIWLFPSGRMQETKPLYYSGKKSQKSILLWLKKKAPRIKAEWGSIKTAIKKAKEAIEEQKRLVEEKKKAFEEELEKLEKIDISGDGGVIKQIIQAGEGDTNPTKGAKVKAHYTGKLLDGTKFDSSVDRGQPFEFTLGQGQVIKCWDQGFATMKLHEKAYLTCTAEYAYGDRGSGATIPGGATLRFEVELLEWVVSHSNKDEL